jgi:hypothetical protein
VRVDLEGYRAVHVALLELCRAGADGPAGARPPVLVRLESLVEPWLTPQALQATDRQTLASLLGQCNRLDRELGGRRGGALRRCAGLLAVVGGAAAGGWFLNQTYYWTARVEPTARWLWQWMMDRPLLCVSVAAPAVLAAALFTLARCLRA